jgi:hypothetical protein
MNREIPPLHNANQSSSRSDARITGAAVAPISKQFGVRQWPQR